MSTLTKTLGSAGIVLCSLGAWAHTQDLPLVFVEQSESLVEFQIDDYLRETEGFDIAVNEYESIADDVFLRFEDSCDNAPELSFLVDTLRSSTDDENVVTERVIKITSWYVIEVTPDHWARVPLLEMINRAPLRILLFRASSI